MKATIKDALTIISIICIGVGVGLTIIRRANSWEFGLILLVVGGIAFYIRYLSDMATDEPVAEEKT